MRIITKLLLSTALLSSAICAQDDVILSLQELGAGGKLHDVNKTPFVLQERPYHKVDADQIIQTGLRNVVLKLKKDKVQEGDSFKSNIRLEEVEFYYSDQAVAAIKAEYGTVPVVGIYFTNEEVMTQDIFINLLSLKPRVIKFFNVSYPSKDLEPTKFDIDRIIVDPNFSNLQELQFFGTWFEFELLLHPEMARLATIYSDFPAFCYGSQAIEPLVQASRLRELHLPEINGEWITNGTLAKVLADKSLEAFSMNYFEPYLSHLPKFLTGGNLRRLSLGNLIIEKAKKEDVDAFFEALSQHKKLEHLELNFCGWDDYFAEKFVSYLAEGIKLKHLTLEPTQQTETHAGPIPSLLPKIASPLAKMGTLETLSYLGGQFTSMVDLSSNSIGVADEDVLPLSDIFRGNHSLRKIIFRNQRLTDVGFGNLMDSMQELDLTHLELSRYVSKNDPSSAPIPLPALNIRQKLDGFLQSQKNLQHFNLEGYFVPAATLLELVGNFQTNMFSDKSSHRASVKIDLSHVDATDNDLEIWVDGKVKDDNWFKNRTGKIEIRIRESQLSRNVVFQDCYRGDVFELSFYTGKNKETLLKGLPQPKKEESRETSANSSSKSGAAEVSQIQAPQRKGLLGWGTRFGL